MNIAVPSRIQKAGSPTARRRRIYRVLLPWLFLTPLLFLNFVVTLAPAGASVYYAFTDWSGLGTPQYVGLSNFVQMAGDANVRLAFVNNLKWTALNLIFPVGMGLVVASMLAAVKRFTVFYRILFFLPYVVASVINVNIWLGIYNPVRGVGQFLEKMLGWEWINLKPLGDPNLVLYAIYLANLWHWWGFLVVLYLAAMQNVPPDLYEAATMEGANRRQQFFHVTIPGIRPTLLFSLLQTIIWSFLSFDYVYLMTQGGPGHASELLATLSWSHAFENFEVGYAATIGLLLTTIAGLVTLMFVYLRRRGWEI